MSDNANEIVVFADTNVFLQCRPLQDLPWEEDFPAVECVRILIADAVVKEIDRLKNDGNLRRAQRARITNTLFREILSSPNNNVVRQRKGKRIEITFAPTLPVDRTTPVTLDRSRADDNLIEEALVFSQTHASTVVLSADTGPELKAKRHHVRFKRVPDSWLLAAETDERDKQIASLERSLAAIRDTLPQISVLVTIDAQPIDRLTMKIPLYPPLSDAELSEVLAGLRQKYPQATAFGEQTATESKEQFDRRLHALIQSHLIGVSEDDRAEYDQAYTEWAGNAREKFSRLHVLLNAKYRWIAFKLQIENKGNASADHLLVEIHVHGGVKLCLSTEADDLPGPFALAQKVIDYPRLPSPPKAPRPMSAIESAFQGMRDVPLNTDFLLQNRLTLPALERPIGRDRYALEIRESEKLARHTWSIQCQEFRHGREPREIRCWMFASAESNVGKTRLFVRATAANLPEALERHVPIDLDVEPASTVVNASRWQVDNSKQGAESEESDEDGD